MKKSILLLFVTLTMVAVSEAQNATITDTLAYLKSIEARKTEFVGQPFSKLLSELKIDILIFTPIGSNPTDIKQEMSTVFRTKIPKNLNEYKYPCIDIIWLSYVNIDQSLSIAEQTGTFGKWTDNAKQHYQKFVVADLYIRWGEN